MCDKSHHTVICLALKSWAGSQQGCEAGLQLFGFLTRGFGSAPERGAERLACQLRCGSGAVAGEGGLRLKTGRFGCCSDATHRTADNEAALEW